MKKQIQMEELKPVSINGVRQNCYVLGVANSTFSTRSGKVEIKYPSLEREQLPNGFTEGIEIKDYPINSQSVTSYADGADYRNDPAQAVANAPKRVNLGDVAEVQEFLKNDPQNAVRVFRDVLAKLETAQKQTPAPDGESSAPDGSPVPDAGQK